MVGGKIGRGDWKGKTYGLQNNNNNNNNNNSNNKKFSLLSFLAISLIKRQLKFMG